MNIYKVTYIYEAGKLKGDEEHLCVQLITCSSSESAKLAVCMGLNIPVGDIQDVQLICPA